MSFSDEEPEASIETAAHRVTLLPGMEPMLRSFERAVRAARERVFVECYIVRHDEMGHYLGDLLASAAARGVRTRLLYDPLGSEKTDPSFFEGLRARGIEVRAYRDTSIPQLRVLSLPRDHGRTMIVDDVAWTGGAAWGREWLPLARGGSGWHDVCVSVQGPAVSDFERVFHHRWLEAEGEAEVPKDYCTGDKYSDIELLADTPERSCLVYERHRDQIRRAKERVWIENSYFYPTAGMTQDLKNAAARGVSVKVILPGESDLPSMKNAAVADAAEWLEAGIEVFEYMPCVLHSKFALVDDDWSTIGTFNANPASVVLVNEVNLVVKDRGFVGRVAELFERDLRGSLPMTREQVAARPFIEKVRDRITAGAFNALDTAFGPPED